jgi:hypothetical protein
MQVFFSSYVSKMLTITNNWDKFIHDIFILHDAVFVVCIITNSIYIFIKKTIGKDKRETKWLSLNQNIIDNIISSLLCASHRIHFNKLLISSGKKLFDGQNETILEKSLTTNLVLKRQRRCEKSEYKLLAQA